MAKMSDVRLLLEWWWVVFPLASLGFFLLLFAVTLWEKQPIHQYEPVGAEGILNPSPYFVEMNRQAKAAGLTFCGEFRQSRGSSTYACYFAAWLTPDATTLVRIVGGKVAGIAYRRTILSTWNVQDRAIESTDEPGTMDLGGTVDQQLLLNADLDELISFHANRRNSFAPDCRIFSSEQILEQQEARDLIKARKIVSLGYGRFLDSSESVWRYTIKGAFANYSQGYRGQKKQAMQQLARASKKRPGG